MDISNDDVFERHLVTFFKVDEFEVMHHTNHEPYYQIWVTGNILDGFGDKVLACIHLSANDGDTSKLCELENKYSIGSIHKIDTSIFGINGKCINFFIPDTEAIQADKYDIINNKYFMPNKRWKPDPECHDFSKIALSSIASLNEKKDGSFVRMYRDSNYLTVLP